jgi:hypothetical protein
MYTGKIGDYRFELEQETSRIVVYKEGTGVDPVAYIPVNKSLTEKDFHYEIMDFVTKISE